MIKMFGTKPEPKGFIFEKIVLIVVTLKIQLNEFN
jgi:hypothetical protein